MDQSRAAGVRRIATVVVVAGIVMIVAGVVTYIVVSTTLADQKITVASDADAFAGATVDQPWEAYAQADIIAEHANEIAGGKTYAELPQDDPNRETVMTASFLQASLFTSVVAFGVAVMAAGLGVMMLLIGVALRRVAAPAISPATSHAAS